MKPQHDQEWSGGGNDKVEWMDARKFWSWVFSPVRTTLSFIWDKLVRLWAVMMKNANVLAVFALIGLLLVLGLSAITSGHKVVRDRARLEALAEFRAQAVECGVASWVITNELTGASGFKWKETK